MSEVIEAYEKFLDAPSFSRFVMALAGGGKINTTIMATALLMHTQNNQSEELIEDYFKYVLGGPAYALYEIVKP